jgi:hypothetical protein
MTDSTTHTSTHNAPAAVYSDIFFFTHPDPGRRIDLSQEITVHSNSLHTSERLQARPILQFEYDSSRPVRFCSNSSHPELHGILVRATCLAQDYFNATPSHRKSSRADCEIKTSSRAKQLWHTESKLNIATWDVEHIPFDVGSAIIALTQGKVSKACRLIRNSPDARTFDACGNYLAFSDFDDGDLDDDSDTDSATESPSDDDMCEATGSNALDSDSGSGSDTLSDDDDTSRVPAATESDDSDAAAFSEDVDMSCAADEEEDVSDFLRMQTIALTQVSAIVESSTISSDKRHVGFPGAYGGNARPGFTGESHSTLTKLPCPSQRGIRCRTAKHGYVVDGASYDGVQLLYTHEDGIRLRKHHSFRVMCSARSGDFARPSPHVPMGDDRLVLSKLGGRYLTHDEYLGLIEGFEPKIILCVLRAPKGDHDLISSSILQTLHSTYETPLVRALLEKYQFSWPSICVTGLNMSLGLEFEEYGTDAKLLSSRKGGLAAAARRKADPETDGLARYWRSTLFAPALLYPLRSPAQGLTPEQLERKHRELVERTRKFHEGASRSYLDSTRLLMHCWTENPDWWDDYVRPAKEPGFRERRTMTACELLFGTHYCSSFSRSPVKDGGVNRVFAVFDVRFAFRITDGMWERDGGGRLLLEKTGPANKRVWELTATHETDPRSVKGTKPRSPAKLKKINDAIAELREDQHLPRSVASALLSF